VGVVQKQKGFTLLELLIVVAIIGIIAGIAIPNLLVALQRARQRRTMVDMRNVAMAWEARSLDVSSYNAAGSLPGLDRQISFTDLNTSLAPTYIKVLPLNDGWGHPFQAWSDQNWSNVIVAQQYAIVSPGREGQFSTTPTLGIIQNFDCDIIFSNGSFLAYPEGASTSTQ
jgi:general secretion pathway protein G